MKTICYVQSNIGTTRPANEDNFYCCGSYRERLQAPVEELLQNPEGASLLFAVFDGMGGETAGDEASLLCAQTLDRERIEDGMFEAPAYYHRANAAVTSLGQRLGETSGSTAAVAYLRANRLFVSNVGDSRVYHLRGNALRCLTYDHTRYQQLSDSGYAVIDESERHVLTQFLGMGIQRPMSPHFAISVQLEVGDRILLCSDGLSGTLDDAEIRDLLQDGGPEQTGRALVRKAMDAGSMDNITVLIADVSELDEGEDPLADPWSDAPVTRRFDVPTPDQIMKEESAAERERRREIRKSVWLVILSLLGVLAVSGGIIWLALYHAPNRDAATPTTMMTVDGDSDIWYHQTIQSLGLGDL
ncbi:MAG: serine/threonine-protein phosphatase [Oscillospiraceae bacterium]|nr:serine/threonine-protein phosphatase [Oscillospiraceae bacterium]MBQ6402447.1 serine/threonine-protein phosphatase [Oscillospiraceae bacterium]